MRMGRRIGAVVAALTAATSLAAGVATAASAAPQLRGPEPVTQLLPGVDSGRSEWVSVLWKTDRPVCDFKVMVWGNGNVRIDYPGRRGYATFARNDSLRRGQTATTTFRVTARYDRSVWAILAANVTYNHCGRQSPTITKSTGLMLPVRA
jgi:hypothetical protein